MWNGFMAYLIRYETIKNIYRTFFMATINELCVILNKP
jgi:hypothetical protein